jgi:hypothetical protein
MRASSEIRASPQVRSISARPGWHQGGDVRETLARRPGGRDRSTTARSE